jgi:hypothetical protein
MSEKEFWAKHGRSNLNKASKPWCYYQLRLCNKRTEVNPPSFDEHRDQNGQKSIKS